MPGLKSDGVHIYNNIIYYYMKVTIITVTLAGECH